ncbi:MAG TPA: oligosaccharide flippase family protein [Polyangia bacterium]|jgi:O-antigen/teichoic acid export membrane protein
MGGAGNLLKRVGHYASASVVSILCGLVSYPLFTRKLEVEDYGAMGLIQVILLAGVAAAKLGLQNSIIRLWPVYDRDDAQRDRFSATYFFTALGLGTAATVLCVGVAVGLRQHLPPRLVWPLGVAAFLIPTRALFSFAQNFLRARERSTTYALVSIGNAVLGLALAALLVLAVMPLALRLSGFYLGLLVAELLVVAVALRASFAGMSLRTRDFDWSLVREGVWFGAPLILFEFSAILLGMGDRFIIEIFWSERQLGFYTAAYSLAWQIASLYTFPVDMAVVPMYTNLYERDGREAARAFLARGTRLYYLLALPVIAGLWAVREDIIVVFASAKYREAQSVLPVLIAAFLILGSRMFLAAGLFLAKQTRLMALIALAGAVVNIGLNLLLVPRFGIDGSAVGTMLGMLLTVLGLALFSRRAFAVDLALPRLALYAAASAGMGLLVSLVRTAPATGGSFGQHLLQLVARIGLGVVAYGLFALVAEPEARSLGARLVARVRGRR